MQRHCWRWLWIWVGVLVAGCGQIWSSEGTPSATREPTLPLLGYTLLPPSLTPGLPSGIRPAHTATPLIAADATGVTISPLAVYLRIIGPACYETPVGSLLCLGQVYNPLDSPVEQVTVGVQLLAPDGSPLAMQEALLARVILPAGSTGPYRVLFDSPPPGYAFAHPTVLFAQFVPPDNRQHTELALREVSGSFVIDQYQVTLSIINKNAAAVGQVSVTMTLLDDQGQVTGFRQMLLDTHRYLEPGESVALTMKVIPQGDNTVGFDAFAEGYFVSGD